MILYPCPNDSMEYYLPHETEPAVTPSVKGSLEVFEALDIKLIIPETRIVCRERRFQRPEYKDPAKGGARDPDKPWLTEQYFDGITWYVCTIPSLPSSSHPLNTQRLTKATAHQAKLRRLQRLDVPELERRRRQRAHA